MIHLHNNGNPLIAPDHRSYDHLVSDWVITRQPNSSEISDWWLHRMWEDYNETVDEIIRPNVHTYNKVMAYFSQLGHAVKVELLMSELLNHEVSKDTSLHPNTGLFSLVIDLLIKNGARSSRYNIGERLCYALDANIIFRYPKVFFWYS